VVTDGAVKHYVQIFTIIKPAPSFLRRCPSCHPTNSVKHWRESL